MELARVVGQCTATVKEGSLAGRRLALVRQADPEGVPTGPVEVALDVTGAGPGALVVLVRGSAARQPAENRQLATDLSIIAIVDEVNLVADQSATGAARPSAAATRAATKKTAATRSAPSKTAARRAPAKRASSRTTRTR